MSSARDLVRSADLDAFFERLRRHGFDVGIGHYLRVARLLDRTEGITLHQIKTVLCPLFATNREQQEDFYFHFDSFFPMLAEEESKSDRPGHLGSEDRAPTGPPPVDADGGALPEVAGSTVLPPGRSSPTEAGAGGGSAAGRPKRHLARAVAVVGSLTILAYGLWPERPNQQTRVLSVATPVFADQTVPLVWTDGGNPAEQPSGVEYILSDGLRMASGGAAVVPVEAGPHVLEWKRSKGSAPDTILITAHERTAGALEIVAPGTLHVGDSAEVTARVVTTTGLALDAEDAALGGVPVSWGAADSTVASVTAGWVRARAPGSATIEATAYGQFAEALISITPAPVVTTVSIEASGQVLQDEVLSVRVGGELTLSGLALDGEGVRVAGARLEWRVEDRPDIATVDGNGLVRGTAPGEATIRLSANGIVAFDTVTVRPAVGAVAWLEVSPRRLGAATHESVHLEARSFDANGDLVGSRVTWRTDGPPAEISDTAGAVRWDRQHLPTVQITAQEEGVVTIFAETPDGVTATATLLVEDRPLALVLASSYWIAPGITGLAVAILLLIYLWSGGHLTARRESGTEPSGLWTIRPPEGPQPYASSIDFPGAVRALRTREAGEVRRFDPGLTIRSTIESGGYPTFRYSYGTRPPEYVALLERATLHDHGMRLFHHLVSGLVRNGVHISEYSYTHDPRLCDAARDGSRHRLVDMYSEYRTHRVMLFSDGEGLLDPVTGRLKKWVEDVFPWQERALLTPVPPSAWGLREIELSRHFVVLPATVQALAVLVGHIDRRDRPSLKDWHSTSTTPPPPRLDRLSDPIPALREYLGEAAFRWLAAAAVYPELQWDLTLFIGGLPVLGKNPVTEDNVLRLIQLPWFREGVIPPEIREALIDDLDPETAHGVREEIFEVLKADAPLEGTRAADRYRLNLVIQQVESGKTDPASMRRLRQDLQKTPTALLSQATVVLRFLRESDRERGIRLPRPLRRMLRRYALKDETTGRRLGWAVAAVLALQLFGGLFAARTVANDRRELAWLDATEPQSLHDRDARFREARFESRERGGDVLALGLDLLSADGSVHGWAVRVGAADSTLVGPSSESPWTYGGLASSSTGIAPRPIEDAPPGTVQALTDDLLAQAREGGAIEIVDRASGDLLGTLQGVSAEVIGLTFSPAGNVLVSVHEDGSALLWGVPEPPS